MNEPSDTPETSPLPVREQWKNLWNALGELEITDDSEPFPEAEKYKRLLLRRLALDPRTNLEPSQIFDLLQATEPSGATVAVNPPPLGIDEADDDVSGESNTDKP